MFTCTASSVVTCEITVLCMLCESDGEVVLYEILCFETGNIFLNCEILCFKTVQENKFISVIWMQAYSGILCP